MNLPKLGIVGAKGRMGKALLQLAEPAGFQVEAALDQGDDLEKGLEACDVIIDFSVHTITVQVAEQARQCSVPLVIGTTGHTPKEIEAVGNRAKAIPIVFAPNFSVGVNTLFWLTRKAAEILGLDFDLEVVEMHHHLKKDAPSGTAKHLAEILCEVRKLQYERDVRHGRYGLIGERAKSEIGMHAIRGGDVVGDHTVIFAALGERVELSHRASSRETFAQGALRAAHWVLDQKPDLYNMQDVLGLR